MSKEIKQNLEFNIKLSDFDGPLDVLINLITEHKLNIFDLDIAQLTKQYLVFVQKNIKQINIDEASEYLTMATHLLGIKSKRILPTESIDQQTFEYERDKLVARLIEYKKYKDSISVFIKKQDNRLNMYAKQPDDLEDYAPVEKVIESLPTQINPDHLLKALENIFDKYRLQLFSRHKILVQELAVDEVEKDITTFLKSFKKKQISFSDFLSHIDEIKLSQQYIVTCFLALLELAKYRQINLVQPSNDDDIYFSKNTNIEELEQSKN